jgi:cephalosporin hydroxylase
MAGRQLTRRRCSTVHDPSNAEHQRSHDSVVPAAEEFAASRAGWRDSLGSDAGLRQQAVDLQVRGEDHHYTYTWEWLGVPIIRLPDDVMVLQEIAWAYRPQRIVETGVARGGSMLLDASLMRLCDEEPAVLGIDLQIFPHTREALDAHPLAHGVDLLEADSTSPTAEQVTRRFLAGADRALLVLDSNHTHDHVLAELRLLAPLLPVGGLVLVADTLVEEFPAGHYDNRPWDKGNNPATAVRAFLAERSDFELAQDWSRRALVTEFRDGVLRRIGPATGT